MAARPALLAPSCPRPRSCRPPHPPGGGDAAEPAVRQQGPALLERRPVRLRARRSDPKASRPRPNAAGRHAPNTPFSPNPLHPPRLPSHTAQRSRSRAARCIPPMLGIRSSSALGECPPWGKRRRFGEKGAGAFDRARWARVYGRGRGEASWPEGGRVAGAGATAVPRCRAAFWGGVPGALRSCRRFCALAGAVHARQERAPSPRRERQRSGSLLFSLFFVCSLFVLCPFFERDSLFLFSRVFA